MGYWNYRVIMLENNRNETYFEVHEVHYKENNVPYAYAESHNLLVDDTLEDLKESYEYMSNAFKLPVLKVVDGKLVEVTSSS